jgi:proteasome lid subunit RPN8/RPN11
VIRVESFAGPRPGPGPRPVPPVRLAIGSEILGYTQGELREASAGIRESLVVWAGQPGTCGAIVTHVITPDTESTRDHLTVPSATRAELASYLRREGLLLFADLHTHPAAAFLSEADRAQPFSSRPGFYAIVVPEFAAGPPGAGWCCYESTGVSWREVSLRDRCRTQPL